MPRAKRMSLLNRRGPVRPAPHRIATHYPKDSRRSHRSVSPPSGGKALLALFSRPALALAFLTALATGAGQPVKASALPLPRFVSLKTSNANLRVGPGVDYHIDWVFKRTGMPLEIYQQYGNWRRVRGWDGTSGWIYGALLSGRRTGMVAPWSKNNVALRRRPTAASSPGPNHAYRSS